MDLYHIWCDLKPGVHDTGFCDAAQKYLQHLQSERLIENWRLTRRKLGLGSAALGEFHIIIETKDLAQLDAAFGRVASRREPIEGFHFGPIRWCRMRCSASIAIFPIPCAMPARKNSRSAT